MIKQYNFFAVFPVPPLPLLRQFSILYMVIYGSVVSTAAVFDGLNLINYTGFMNSGPFPRENRFHGEFGKKVREE